MKTMKDFEGTPGEFKINQSRVVSQPYRLIVYAPDNHRVALCYKEGSGIYPRFEKAAEANARLFANSKKVLEAAIEAHIELKRALTFEVINSGGSKEDVNKYIASNIYLIQLEQAINDSL